MWSRSLGAFLSFCCNRYTQFAEDVVGKESDEKHMWSRGRLSYLRLEEEEVVV